MKPETIALHKGFHADPTTNAVAVPIYQTTSYAFNDTQHGADLFSLKVAGNIYTRLMNPTTNVLEERMAALEGGIGAVATASGMAAIAYAVETLTEAGDNIISSNRIYGGSVTYFTQTLKRRGVEVRFIEHANPEEILKVADSKTKLVFCESICNPTIDIADLPAYANYAHQVGVPLVVDNTVATPLICRPIELGADIVVHSLTKYVGGHGTTIGGCVIDGGKFDWKAQADKYPILTQPDPSYHGVVYADALGSAAFIGCVRVVGLRNTGAAMTPIAAFMFQQGLESLSVRLERHCQNALKVAEFLQKHPQVSWVNYPGLADAPQHSLIERDFGGRASGLLSFGIKGGREAGAKFIDALKLVLRLVNIGDSKSLACHPATTTHSQMTDEELEAAGVTSDLIRLSVGLEHIDDILDDLSQAFEAAK
ncbi:O-acetylhomoserine aminocarboxypropyltransferase/cysteine synthase [Mannheimia sp. AT1]|uniref:O-acetylhomoserine aminocarboxypropyltransferase/cysteine synthase n=1 Tax=Mannheimia cairinae TaxID=3025936 RepID=A0ABT5MRI6_9PAST|nr:O-acetylhomoserine aminocarboxypropyltransferase/cysteine synthase [Mannheimia cairinae]MDD0824094.1 O-acetylhomoserine aminocarboxypropyltransferase/cysteine synthase [Mannheimia cairinae]MDD0826799.1 O-acetylhomoserine aminocarboxypropyltransferase/cysteine synthase [Mannheimia cairinae]